MTLTEILQIKEQCLQDADLRAMTYCENRWQQEGRPAERWEMFNFIERMLRELQHNGIGYPKILLKRKKEIQRRTFTVERNTEAPKHASPSSTDPSVREHPKIPVSGLSSQSATGDVN
jgi:hypothetical protein